MEIIKTGTGKGIISLGQTIPIDEYFVVINKGGNGGGYLSAKTTTNFTISSVDGSVVSYQVIRN